MSVGNIIFCVLVGVIVLGIWIYLVWWENITDFYSTSEGIAWTLAGLVVIGIGEAILYSFLESSESFSIGDALSSLFASVIFTIVTVLFICFFVFFVTCLPCSILSGETEFKPAGKVCGILLPLIMLVLFSSWLRSSEPTEPSFLFNYLDIIHVAIWLIGSIIIRIYNTVEQNKINNRKKQNELHEEKVAVYNSIRQSEKELYGLKDKLDKNLTISNMVTLLECCGESTYDINKNLKPYYDELDNIKSEIQNKEDEVNNLKAENERKNKL